MFTGREGQHDAPQLTLAHLTVGHRDAGPRQQTSQLLGLRLDGLDAVVDEEHLTAAVEFAQHGVAHEGGRGFRDACLDGQPILWRRLDDAHVADADESEVQRARDGRGRQRKHVDLGLESLESLLVGDAETLLLVDDDEAEVLELDVLAEEAMGTDDQINAAGREPSHGLELLLSGHEAAERTDGHGVGREPLGERGEMLRGKHRRRYEHGHLRTRRDGLEGGAQCDFGLAVADIPDHEAVHRSGPFQVGLDLDRRAELIGRLLVRERRLHLGLPGRVLAERTTLGIGPARIQVEELMSEVTDRLLDAGPGPLPLTAAELGEGRIIATGIARDAFDLLDRHPHAATFAEVQLEEVALLATAAAGGSPHEPGIPRHAVVNVDDDIASFESLEQVTWHHPPHGLWSPHANRAEQFAVGDEGQAVGPTAEATVEAAFEQPETTRRDRRRDATDRSGHDARVPEDLRQTGRLIRGEDHAGPFPLPAPDGGRKVADRHRRQRRLTPAEWVATRRRPAHLGLPRQLEPPGRRKMLLPLAWTWVRVGPSPGQLTRSFELGLSGISLLPEEVGHVGDVVRFIDDPDSRTEVVERRGRSKEAGPGLGGIT